MQDGVQDGCRELKFSICKAIFNIHKCCFWYQTVGVGFNSIFKILKVPVLLNIRKGSISRWRPRWLLRAKILFSIFKAICNIEKSFWCQTVGFNSSFNILRVPFLMTIRKGSFSRWHQTINFNSVKLPRFS